MSLLRGKDKLAYHIFEYHTAVETNELDLHVPTHLEHKAESRKQMQKERHTLISLVYM